MPNAEVGNSKVKIKKSNSKVGSQRSEVGMPIAEVGGTNSKVKRRVGGRMSERSFNTFRNRYFAFRFQITFFFSVITVISGHMPRRPEKAKKPKPRFTYRYRFFSFTSPAQSR